MKKALITGVTGQDGAYLSEFLLSKGYEVHGIKRRSSSFNTARVDHLFKDKHENRNHGFKLHYGDVTDSTNIIRLIKEIEPDEIYNLAAQSHVRVSFETPEYTAQADALGALRILEAIRILGLEKKVRFYQASSSELYGKVHEVPQHEGTPFYPRSPYAVAKLYAYWITVNYREAYNIYACNGILFNHESPHRGETFVTRKITRAVAHIVHGLKQTLYLGNLDAKRDWGYAPDYVEAMWLMLQQQKPEDFVIATGKAYSVRDFVEAAFRHVAIEIIWSGSGPEEVGHDARSGKLLVAVDPVYFRPTEVDILVGDATKARNLLGWEPKVGFEELVKIMMQSDLEAISSGELKLVEQPDKFLSELTDNTTQVEKMVASVREKKAPSEPETWLDALLERNKMQETKFENAPAVQCAEQCLGELVSAKRSEDGRDQKLASEVDTFICTELVAQATEQPESVVSDQQNRTSDGFIQLTLK